jgi:ABC-type nitrate/sulfonate/bicarbonate transport system permease component
MMPRSEPCRGALPTFSASPSRSVNPKIISPLVLLIAWEVAIRAHLLDSRLIAPPSLIALELWKISTSGELFSALGASMMRAISGFLIAAVLGIGLGSLMARVRAVEVIFDPLIELFRPVSPLALFPLFILWFGIGETAKILIITFACSFPILLNTYAGVRGIDVTLVRASRSLGASPTEVMRTVILPGSLPSIFTGLRVSWGIALIVIIAAEMIGAVRGIGYMVLFGQQTFQIPLVFASIVVIGTVGILTDAGFRFARRMILPWYRELKE